MYAEMAAEGPLEGNASCVMPFSPFVAAQGFGNAIWNVTLHRRF